MPLFETSALLILIRAYQFLTNDLSYADQYQLLILQYADYLIASTLYPATQLISVDAIRPSTNQTGLAMQATIGLGAAAILTENWGYLITTCNYAKIIYEGGLGLDGATPNESTHFTYNYGEASTWNVLFTAFSDVVLQLYTFPQSAWDMQSAWYLEQLKEYGLPFAGPVDDLNYTGVPFTWGLTDWSKISPCSVLQLYADICSFRHCRRQRIFRRSPRSGSPDNAHLHDEWIERYTVRHQV